MIMRDMRQEKAQKVAQWWARTHQYIQLSHRLASDGSMQDLSRIRDIDACIHNLDAQFKAVEHIPYPREAMQMRQSVLAFLMNMITVMQHTRLGNENDRKVIFDIALINKHMIEFHIEEFGLS